MMTTTTVPVAQVWDEMIELKGTLSDFLQQGLTLKFFDYDFGSRDDPLGESGAGLHPRREKNERHPTDLFALGLDRSSPSSNRGFPSPFKLTLRRQGCRRRCNMQSRRGGPQFHRRKWP